LQKGAQLSKNGNLFVKAITDSVVSTLGVKPEWVSVLIEEFDRENWSTGGELHSDKFGSGRGCSGTK